MELKYLKPKHKRRLEKYGVQESSKDVIYVQTADNWELAICRYHPLDNTNGFKHKTPVLLCHGLQSNRLTFELDAENSLVRHLLGLGYPVYSMDLRGRGLSQQPGQGGKKYGWGFFDYLHYDIPTCIKAVCDDAEVDKIHYIGHSMGGILIASHAAITESPAIKSAISIGSGLDYSQSKSVLKKLLPFHFNVARHLPAIPLFLPDKVMGFLTGWSKKGIDPALTVPNNVELDVYKKMVMTTFSPISEPVITQLSPALTEEQLGDSEHGKYQARLEEKGYPFPFLSMAGSRDLVCPLPATKTIGTDWMGFGKKFGHQHEYGHMDLIIGKHVQNEVYPHISDWLEKHNDS